MGRSINVLGVYGEQMERKFVELSGGVKGNVEILAMWGNFSRFSFENS
jgi:hypothetical protein